MAAIGAGEFREVGVRQARAADAAGIFAFLMHADRAVHGVVHQHGDDRQIVSHGGCEFLSMHHEAAVTGKADDFAILMQRLGGNGRRQAVAHRAGGGGGLRAVFPEAVEAVNPGGVIAGAIGEDRVGGGVFFEIGHDRAHMDAFRA